MEIGAQLFTVREACKNLDDFAESLKKVADIGYKTVQVSGTCDYEPQWLAEQLKKTGNSAAYQQVMVAVSDFETGNLRLSAVLNSLEV